MRLTRLFGCSLAAFGALVTSAGQARLHASFPVKPGQIMVLGETHGTQETPAYVERVISDLSRKGNLVLGLELRGDSTEVSCVDGVKAVPESWANARADGRTSQAMRALTCRALELQRAGALKVVFLDPPRRDRNFDSNAAASFASAFEAKPGAIGLVFVGNYHSRNVQGSLAEFLRASGHQVITATAASTATAKAWQCQQDGCGEKSFSLDLCKEVKPDTAPTWWKSSDPRWDRCIVFKTLSASSPFDIGASSVASR